MRLFAMSARGAFRRCPLLRLSILQAQTAPDFRKEARSMRAAIIALCLSLAVPAASSHADERDFAWLAGHWRSENNGRISEEVWMVPEGGLMTGMGRTIRDGRAVSFEFLYITTGEDTAYVAQPGGRPPVRFGLVSQEGESAVFENAEHDFPQRIEYVRDGDTLAATISTMDRGRETSWHWTRQD
jgi:hypothetical protein